MELERELAQVFLEEARGHLAALSREGGERGARVAAARSLATAAGLVGLAEVKAAADDAAGALARGASPDEPARRLAGLLDGLSSTDPVPGIEASELETLLVSFREEAAEHLDGMTAALLALERDRGQRGLVAELLRKTHTLKGSAATVGLGNVSDGAHRLEEILVALGSGTVPSSDEVIDALFGAVDALRELVPVAHRLAAAAPLSARLSQQLARARVPPAPARPRATTQPIVIAEDTQGDRRAHDPHVLRVDAARLDQLMDGVGELVFDRSRIERRAGELRAVMRELGKVRAGLRALIKPGRAGKLGEVEDMLARHVAHLGRATAALLDDAEALRRTTATLQSGLTQVRMTKVRWLFQRLARPLRDLERMEGKRVSLTTSGDETELDKAVVDKITDPLIAILRNALAHGIEPAAERAARGKPPAGRVTLAARHEGDAVFLEVSDDGAGIDPARVRASLIAAGRLTPEVAAMTPDAQIVAAIFEPGVSTRDAPDELAGRGVGLDVVRENIARLGGDITVTSTPGLGSRFTIRLPLTTAISQAFLFKVGGQVYALPNVHIIETLTLDVSGPALPPATLIGDTMVPLVSLHKVLGVDPPDARRVPVITLEFAGRRLAATCDKIVGPREIVVKSLGPLLAPLGLYAGGTISGAGKVQLILDPAALVEIAHPAEARLGAAGAAELPAGEPRPRILVADDSRTVREAISRMLSAEAYVVDLAADGQEAWEMLHEVGYQLLVTDLEMPGLSGVALIERVRGEAGAARLPILAISSRGAHLREGAESAGADEFLAKPVTRQELARRVAQLLVKR